MINRTGLTYDREVVRRLPAVEDAVRDLKNRQFIGADSMTTEETSESSFFIPAMTSGINYAHGFSIYAEVKKRYISEIKLSFFLTNDANPDFLWPYGSSVDPDDLSLGGPWVDLAFSDELGIGNKTYFITLKNNTGAPLDLYGYMTILYGKQEVAVV